MDTLVKRLPDLRAYLDQRLGQVQDHRGWEWLVSNSKCFDQDGLLFSKRKISGMRTTSTNPLGGKKAMANPKSLHILRRSRYEVVSYLNNFTTIQPSQAMEEGRLSHTYVSSQSAKHVQLCEANDSATVSFFRKRTDASICWPMNFLWYGPIFESTSLCINGDLWT